MKLSKSRFIRGKTCTKAMWLDTHEPDLVEYSDADRKTLDQGEEVGQIARQLFPEGELIYQYPQSLGDAIKSTQEKIAAGLTVLFEAVFEFQNVLVISDILIKQGDGDWQLIETKSATKVKDYYYDDLALQQWVLEGNGLTVSQCNVLHVNNQCVGVDLENFFIEENVTEEVRNRDVEGLAVEYLDILHENVPPEAPIGKWCKKCDYEGHCLGEKVNHSIYYIPRISDKKVAELEGEDVIDLSDITDGFEFTEKQRAFIDTYQEQSIDINIAAIHSAMEDLEFPLYFFDFETVNPAVPLADNIRPYQQTAFQYSLHILQADGSLTHHEYLHPEATDPSRPLAEQIVRDIGEQGSVVAYNIGFERGVLEKLAAAFPDLHNPLVNIADRLWDQLPLVRDHYQHYQMGPSNSIKAILPIIAPDLSYKELKISQGDHAGVIWQEMIYSQDVKEREVLRDALLAYCHLDTLAMVKLHQHFKTLK